MEKNARRLWVQVLELVPVSSSSQTKPGELPDNYTCAAHEWVKRGNAGKGCRAKSQSHLKSVAQLHSLRLALSPDFICSEGLLVQLLISADEQ